MRQSFLMFFLLTTVSICYSQKEMDLTIRVERGIDQSKISFNFFNGRTDITVSDTFQHNELKLRRSFFSEVVTLKISNKMQDGSEDSRMFFVGDKKAVISIKPNEQLKDGTLRFAVSNATIVTDTAANELYRDVYRRRLATADLISALYEKFQGEALNSDSVKQLHDKYFKKLNSETMDFLKEHASEYFSLWYFGYQVVAPSSSMFKYDTAYLRGLVEYFKTVFPLKYQQSFEGKGMMQALEGRIKPPGVSDIAPDFTITDINSKKISLAKLKVTTRFILLDFWASWCGPCLATIPVLKEMAANYTAENLAIIGISLDRDLRDLKKTVAAQKMTWPQIQDVEDDMSNKFGAFKIPAFVLIDNKGVIIFRGTGLEDKERLNAQLKKLIHPAKEIK
jgi:thiol-disulfide isomerase/thioredoxin